MDIIFPEGEITHWPREWQWRILSYDKHKKKEIFQKF